MTPVSRMSVAASAAVLALVILLPLAAALVAGRTMAEFTAFPPPLEIPTGYLPFSPLAAGAVAVLLVALVGSWVACRRAVTRAPGSIGGTTWIRQQTFPAWGWLALGWTLLWWVLAWTRWEWFKPLQHYTFFPLWVGLIITFNAVTQWRTGSCLMRRAPGRWLVLFPVSAACWWTFEWLNRFVRNWHYLNAEEFGAVSYFLHASVCFSTVLPAVAAIAEWLSSHRGWNAVTACGPAWSWIAGPRAQMGLIAFGCVSLFATGMWPQFFYPALWVSPLALLLGTSGARPSALVQAIAAGDWRRPASWMIAALICGFFWELWNWQSLAKWIYTVPGVERWHLFEMPALGYAGYLPFGLECLLVAHWVIGDCWISPSSTGEPATPEPIAEMLNADEDRLFSHARG